MSTLTSIQSMIEPASSVAGNADLLSVAVAHQDRDQIEVAVDDLVRSYDRYAGQAASQGRLKFDEAIKMDNPQQRDLSATATLASALIDVQIAVLLSQAAQAVGEMEGESSAGEINNSAAGINQTVNAIQGTSGVDGQTRLAFDGTTTSTPVVALVSPDLPTAKEAFIGKTKDIYDRMLTDSTSLWQDMFKEISGLDQNQINEGLKAIEGSFNIPAVGKVVPKVLDALQRAITTMKDLIGAQNLKDLDEEVSKAIEAMKKGEGALQIFFKYSFQFDDSQQKITAWADGSQSEIELIDNGTECLRDLENQTVQTFAMSNKIVTNLKRLSAPINWLLKKWGGTLPADILLAGTYCLVGGITLLRIMDYADTTTIVKFVDGTLTISKQALGVTD